MKPVTSSPLCKEDKNPLIIKLKIKKTFKENYSFNKLINLYTQSCVKEKGNFKIKDRVINKNFKKYISEILNLKKKNNYGRR
jgi:hypothetical protein